MVGTPPLVAQPVARPIGERRVAFRGLDWQRFLSVRQALGDRRAARLTYDRGVLEIAMPLEDHEFATRMFELFVRVLVVELSMKLKTMGSTSLDRADSDRAAEPDNAYYIQNQPAVAGRTVDLDRDPPPDLVIEIDITHTDIDKLRLYASLGIPEFWHYNGETWRIFSLYESEYREVETSPTFPLAAKDMLYEFLAAARRDEVEAELALRDRVRARL